MDSRDLAALATEALTEKKGRDIESIDIAGKTILADWFVLCSGTSVTHIRSLADGVTEKLSRSGRPPLRLEGYDSARWILLDFGDVVVHIFHETERAFYNLERLWTSSFPVSRKKPFQRPLNDFPDEQDRHESAAE